MREGGRSASCSSSDSSTEDANKACIPMQIQRSCEDYSHVCTSNGGSAADDHHDGNADDDHHEGNADDDDHHDVSDDDDAVASDDFLQATVDELRDHLLALITSVHDYS